jgi:hypothetical protein
VPGGKSQIGTDLKILKVIWELYKADYVFLDRRSCIFGRLSRFKFIEHLATPKRDEMRGGEKFQRHSQVTLNSDK